tara:strand:+ start:279 stop:740 length:462 start_codon:yes stop_codon:yes gene_type:complete
MKQIMENFNRFVSEEETEILEEQELLNENPLAVLAGAGVLIALKTKAGRALIARVLRITGNLCDKLNRSVTKAIGNDSPRMKKILDLSTELMPARLLMDELAEVLEELSDDEAKALNDALGPAKLATPAGRLAIGQQAGSKVLDVTDYKEEPS